MSWKKTLPFFIWQSIKYASGWQHFWKIWSYRRRWQFSFQSGRNSVNDELPWINFMAIDFLKQHLPQEARVFEFGGGGSTLFFCKSAVEVMTVEDNAAWFDVLTKKVQDKGYQNWTGFFVQPEPASERHGSDYSDPANFKSSVANLRDMQFEKYARTINRFPEAFFDLILVDGRARPSCIQQAIPHLKRGGLLVVDNTERPHYLASFRQLIAEQFTVEEEHFFPVAYTPDFTKTTILRLK